MTVCRKREWLFRTLTPFLADLGREPSNRTHTTTVQDMRRNLQCRSKITKTNAPKTRAHTSYGASTNGMKADSSVVPHDGSYQLVSGSGNRRHGYWQPSSLLDKTDMLLSRKTPGSTSRADRITVLHSQHMWEHLRLLPGL